MKKRLLITSIVMMLVVAVALGTSTYAWFTSNTRVEASSISLTAQTSGGAAFGISWTNEDYGTALESLTGPSTAFYPLVPEEYSTTTNSETTPAVTFYTATMRQEGGDEKYNGDVKFWNTTEEAKAANARDDAYSTDAKPYIWTNGTQNSFYIKNLSTSNGQDHLYVFADVTGAASDLVRIAIFDTDKLVGILGYTYTYTSAAEATWVSGTTYFKHVTDGYLPDATIVDETTFNAKKATLYTRSAASVVTPVYYGEVEADEDVLTTYSNSVKVIDLGHFNALEYREIKVYVWLDGKYLNDDTQSTTASVSLSFDVTNPYAG